MNILNSYIMISDCVLFFTLSCQIFSIILIISMQYEQSFVPGQCDYSVSRLWPPLLVMQIYLI